jgi:hypothetical protein
LVAVEDAIINAGLVLVGFSMAVGWDRIQKKRADNENRGRIFDLINVETENNATMCQQILTANAGTGLMGITTIPPLHDIGWDTAISNWSLLRLNSNETLALNNAYRSAGAVNEAIRVRDTYSISMVAMSNYAQSLASLNTLLVSKAQLFLANHGELQPFLTARLEKVGLLAKLRRVHLRRRS